MVKCWYEGDGFPQVKEDSLARAGQASRWGNQGGKDEKMPSPPEGAVMSRVHRSANAEKVYDPGMGL